MEKLLVFASVEVNTESEEELKSRLTSYYTLYTKYTYMLTPSFTFTGSY